VIAKYLLPFFSVKRLCDLSPGDIQGFITGQAQRFAWQTVQHMRVALNQILVQAVEWGYLRENPSRSVKLPRRPMRPEQVILTPDQVRKLLQVLQEPYKTLVATAAVTGMRRCELFGLRWCDVDFEQSVFHVRQRVYKGCIDTPKSSRSIRDLPMPGWLSDALRQRRERSRGLDCDLVFAGRSGKPMSPTTVARIGLRLVLKELGFPEVSWHCFRRTLATLLSEQGAQVKIAQEQLGHASARTTLEFYVQAMPGSRRQAIEQIGRILDPNGPKFRRSLDKGVSLIQ
jgi:integrase